MTDRGSESLKANMPQLQAFEVSILSEGENTAPADFLMVTINLDVICHHFINDTSSKLAFCGGVGGFQEKIAPSENDEG